MPSLSRSRYKVKSKLAVVGLFGLMMVPPVVAKREKEMTVDEASKSLQLVFTKDCNCTVDSFNGGLRINYPSVSGQFMVQDGFAEITPLTTTFRYHVYNSKSKPKIIDLTYSSIFVIEERNRELRLIDSRGQIALIIPRGYRSYTLAGKEWPALRKLCTNAKWERIKSNSSPPIVGPEPLLFHVP